MSEGTFPNLHNQQTQQSFWQTQLFWEQLHKSPRPRAQT